jgi:hypothetical protein
LKLLLQIDAESALLNVVASGRFSLAEAKRTFLQMVEASASNNCKKVLFDGRSLIGQLERMERFYYGEFAAETLMNSIVEGRSPARHFAYVLKEPILDPGRFGENVAVNRGMNARTFKTQKDALHWLGVTPTEGLTAGYQRTT